MDGGSGNAVIGFTALNSRLAGWMVSGSIVSFSLKVRIHNCRSGKAGGGCFFSHTVLDSISHRLGVP